MRQTPTTKQEWFQYLKANEPNIYVREQKADGKWDAVALTELTPEQWAKHVFGWIEEGYRIPCAIIPQPTEEI